MKTCNITCVWSHGERAVEGDTKSENEILVNAWISTDEYEEKDYTLMVLKRVASDLAYLLFAKSSKQNQMRRQDRVEYRQLIVLCMYAIWQIGRMKIAEN